MHKSDCNGSYAHRRQYLAPLNSAHHEIFENMGEYKHEDNFKRILSRLTLNDVVDAVNRAKKILQTNQENRYVLQQYKGYRYYKENPSLAIWEAIEKILKDCGLI